MTLREAQDFSASVQPPLIVLSFRAVSGSPQSHIPGDGVDRIILARPKRIAQLDGQLEFPDVFRDRNLESFFLGRERLERGVPNDPQFLLRIENHYGITAVRGLGHVDFCALKDSFIGLIFSGYIQ